MQITLSPEQKRLVSIANAVGHYHFISKDNLAAIARNNGLPLAVVHAFTMNGMLATTEKSVIHLPNEYGEFDPHKEYVPASSNKNQEFAKLLQKSDHKKVVSDPEAPAPIFFKINLDEEQSQTVTETIVKPTLKKEPQNIMNKPENNTVASSEFSISVPQKNPLFVPFGIYEDVETILKSGMFHPIFITGLSGNGKTLSSVEACARLNRKCVRVPITVESDEDSLLGGFRLVDGNTVFQMGPVPEAMMAGATLILDEVDKASSKIMCLQPVLEGEPIYLKRINRMIYPAKGFNVIATANTKGQGSEKGNFVTSLVLDEAFLERFAVTFEQDYPDAKTETKILKMLISSFDEKIDADEFIKLLIEWAGAIRKAYNDGAHSSVITTRRLTHIIKNYAIFGQDKHKSVEMAISRFDTETKTSFYDLWTKKCPIATKSFGNTAKSTTTSYANDKKTRPF